MSKKILPLDTYRKKLTAMRSRLDARIADLRDEAYKGAGELNASDSANAPIHQDDRGSQEAAAEVNITVAETEAGLRQEIDEALLRLENRTFGICTECQDKIDPERLEAIPYSRLCIQCAKRNQ